MCGVLGKKNGGLKTYEMLQEFRGETGDGRELLRENKFEEALQYFGDRLKQYPRSAYYKEGMGIALLELGKYEDAIKYYDSIIQSFDDYLKKYWATSADLFDITFRSLYQKAWLSDRLGREADIKRCYDKAMDCIETLKELSTKHFYPPYPDRLLIFKARVHAALGEYDSAVEYLEKAIAAERIKGEHALNEFKEYILAIPEFESLKDERKFKTLLS